MPRPNQKPLEERLEQAKKLFEVKQEKKRLKLQQVQSSFIYKFSRKTCIVFLWLLQIIIIDWLLPYTKQQDIISSGFSLNNEYTLGMYQSAYNQTEITINTKQNKQYKIEFAANEQARPSINDSIIVEKSFLLRDVKKIRIPRVGQSFYVVTSLTYRYLPVLIIVSGLCLITLFVSNIEVSAFYYVGSFITLVAGIFILYHILIFNMIW